MARRTMTVDDLWALPRVGAPTPSPDGRSLLVPVTTYSMDTDKGTTRLWLVPADGTAAGAGKRGDPARALTSAESSASSPAWSHDGRRVAFVRKPGGKSDDEGAGPRHVDVPQLHVLPLGGGEAERVTDLPLGAAAPHWLPDGRRIVFLSEVYLDARTPDAAAERKRRDEKDHTCVHATEDRFHRYWDSWVDEGKRHHVFVLDLETRVLVDLTPGLDGWIDPMDAGGAFDVAPDGSEVAFAACRSEPPYDPLEWGVFTVAVPKGRLRVGMRIGKPREITPEGTTNGGAPRYSPDARYVAFGVSRDKLSWSDRTRLGVFDRESRSSHVLCEDWGLDPGGWCFDASSRKILCTADHRGRTGLFAVSVRDAIRRARAVPELLREGGAFAGVARCRARIALLVSDLRSPGEVATVAADGGDLRKVTGFTQPIMKQLDMGRVEDVQFEGARGDSVQMFLVHPPKAAGVKQKRLPLVHLIHGGPHGSFSDQWHWRWCAQVFAAQGYLCALVNFHGSTGWGQEFTSCIEGRWGDLSYTDVEKATDHLLARGIVDPKRMAATGGSYGGYMASWIASQTDRYACIVNHAGVCDLQAQRGCDVTHGWARSAGGDEWSDREGLDRFSPMRHAHGFNTPMLVLHGEQDYRVPYYQGLQIYDVHKARGVPARLVVFPNENHWILKPANNKRWYGEFLGWLDRWL